MDSTTLDRVAEAVMNSRLLAGVYSIGCAAIAVGGLALIEVAVGVR
jgi:hypothetical protein